MSGWKLLALAYAGFYALFAYAVYGSNVTVGYPAPYILFSTAMQASLLVGIVAFALDLGPSLAQIWRWMFPLMIVDVLVGVSLDAVVPPDFNLSTHGVAWIINLLLNVWLAAPAYYCSFKVAGYRTQSGGA